MGFFGLIIVMITGILVILLSLALDYLWARVMGAGSIYYLIRAPGIAIHEISHILGCLIMGAKVQNVVLFSRTGGSVTYSRSPVPVLGDLVINAAPLFCIPVVLFLCTWIFSTCLGCFIPALPVAIDSLSVIPAMAGLIVEMFFQNFIARFNPWFILFLYLTVSLVLSLAPSSRDMKNAVAGIVLIGLAAVAIIWSDIPRLIYFLDTIAGVIGMGLGLGLGFGVIALVISLPLAAVWVYRH